MLRHDLGHPAGIRTSRATTAMLLGYLAYRRAQHTWRTSPYTTAVVLPIILVALPLTLALIWRT
ncbi:hypothetical protein [Actinoplanes couchii]|uniref:Uncharacterized protein n=1 Tax=Actinoplanes couchii TaxID=403638 RepID=A0ABQ3XSX7_9ACTN|nr:hypothetical protein [Actinoplanes couchii]MDR6324085.1 hypothetical protein [Actinoplanes couchii]GID61611.1 hypothetical protein Aco03nite_100150 [Actinoplanes couchii]